MVVCYIAVAMWRLAASDGCVLHCCSYVETRCVMVVCYIAVAMWRLIAYVALCWPALADSIL